MPGWIWKGPGPSTRPWSSRTKPPTCSTDLAPSLKKFLKISVPMALGLFLVWYSYNATSAEERERIIHYISNADPFWVGLSVVLGTLSPISRAVRWRYLLAPLG